MSGPYFYAPRCGCHRRARTCEEADERILELETSLRVALENEEDRARQVAESDTKIRELEAELAIQKATTEKWWKAAEKAEAEGERLKKGVQALYDCYNGPTDDRTRGMDRIYRTTTGGGRESGERTGRNDRHYADDLQAESAAANPAAPWCDTCMSWPHEPDCPAARKETKA